MAVRVVLEFLLCSLLALTQGAPIRSSNDSSILSDYMQERGQALLKGEKMMLGYNMPLTDKEQLVNSVLMQDKTKLMESSRVNSSTFPPGQHFFHVRSLIEKSRIFDIIRRMPKGGALHVHDTAMLDPWWLVKNASYRENLYICRSTTPSFHFFKVKPSLDPGCAVGWELMKTVRSRQSNITEFDQSLFNNMTLFVPDPEVRYHSQNNLWKKFQSIFKLTDGLVTYFPVYVDYFYEALKEFREDNVMYVENRALLTNVYDLDGNVFSQLDVLKMCENTIQRFVRDYPDCLKSKVIFTAVRFKPVDEILEDVKIAIKMHQMYPDTMAGFDLVAQEDTGKTLLDYITALLYPVSQNKRLNYFFHAGETDWQGTQVDENLYDAILLNTSRIGHGFALPKHPDLMEVVKQRNIAIEINPISNQVLLLVKDLRDHPGAEMVARGMPIVISSDDPAIFGSRGLSHDFYEAFMAFTGEHGDLRTLKQFALNSLTYSAMSEGEKQYAIIHWVSKWNEFINDVIRDYRLPVVQQSKFNPNSSNIVGG